MIETQKYYSCKKPCKYHDAWNGEKGTHEIGDVIYVYSVDEDADINYKFNGRSLCWREKDGDFLEFWEFELEGEEKKNNQIQEKMKEMDAFLGEQNSLSEELQELNRKALEFMDDSEPSEERGVEKAPATAIRKALAKTRNSLQRIQRDMKTKQEELKSLLEEKQSIFEMKLSELRSFSQKIEEVIWTVDLYLGRKEEIVRLSEGERASAEEKVKIRQLVLYMDEECMVAAGAGGIDFQDITKFDSWLLESEEHLNQVIPEEKAIVVLRVRRKEKEYKDPWTHEQANKENMRTYFLFRNGENLYRVWADINAGKVVFPTRDEYQEIFMDVDYDWDTGKRRKVPLKPGTHKYMEALDRADKKKRHYLRILLVLQGIFDRTRIFAPYPIPKVNICDPKECEEVLEFIHDAEMILGDGRKRFKEFHTENNAKLDVGMRIVGVFSSYFGHHRWYRRGEESRTSCWEKPEGLKLYTIETKIPEEGAFKFYYERQKEIWNQYEGYHKPQKRASYTVYSDDTFYINFDCIEVEDIDYYLTNRLDRKDYIQMVPLLKEVRVLKLQERKEEEPFRQMLQGLILKDYEEVDLELLSEVIFWWKFKNKTHRALVSDDAKATRMILKEYGLRLEKTKQRKSNIAEHKKIADAIRKKEPEAIYIAHKKDSEFVVLVAANNKNIFVHEKTYKKYKRTKELREVKTSEWTTVNKKKHMRCEELWRSRRLDSWNFDAHRNNFLTDLEEKDLVKFALEQDSTKDEWRPTERCLPIAIWRGASEYTFMYTTKGPELPAREDWNNGNRWEGEKKVCPRYPEVMSRGISFKKSQRGVKFIAMYPGNQRPEVWEYVWDHEIPIRKGISRWSNRSFPWTSKNSILYFNKKNFDKVIKETEAARELYDIWDDLWDIGRTLERFLEKRLEELHWEKAHKEYLEDEGDPVFWQDHKKTLPNYSYPRLNLKKPIFGLLKNDEEKSSIEYFDGKTVKEIVDEIEEKGLKIEEKTRKILPMSVVFEAEVEQEEYDEEEEEYEEFDE